MRNWRATGHTRPAALYRPGGNNLTRWRWRLSTAAFAIALVPGLFLSGPPAAAASASASFTPITVSQIGTKTTSWDGGSSNTFLTAKFPAATSSGDLLVVAFQLKNTKATPSLGTVKDSNKNALTKANTLQVGQLEAGVFYETHAPSATSITITPAQKGDTIVATIYDVAGALTASPLDATANNNSCVAGTPPTVSTSTTRFPYELAVGTIAWSQAPSFTPTPNTGYVPSPTVQATTSGEQEGEQSAYLQTSSRGAQTYSGTLVPSVCWTGVIATFAAATQIKPDIAGLLDRGTPVGSAVGGSNFTPPSTMPSGWAGVVVTGIVVNQTWADLQPNGADTAIIAGLVKPSMGQCPTAVPPGSNEIDLALCDVGVWNSANPNSLMYIKLRVWAGEDAPTWAKDIGDNNNPIEGTSYNSITNPGATIGEFWTSPYQSDYDNLMAKLASLYDASPLLEDVEGSACMTEYDEPMLHDDFSTGTGLTNLLGAKYSDTADYACLMSDITSLQNWRQTHVDLSFNPWSLLVNGGVESVGGVNCTGSPCEPLTESFMATFASTFGKQAALANHSIRYGENPGLGYSSMYQHIQTDASANGTTVQYQTADYKNVLKGSSSCAPTTSPYCEGLSETLNWACGATDTYQPTSSGQSASAVELPTGYMSAVFAPYDNFTTAASYAPYLSCIQKDPHG